jgi:hypothetical protein
MLGPQQALVLSATPLADGGTFCLQVSRCGRLRVEREIILPNAHTRIVSLSTAPIRWWRHGRLGEAGGSSPLGWPWAIADALLRE